MVVLITIQVRLLQLLRSGVGTAYCEVAWFAKWLAFAERLQLRVGVSRSDDSQDSHDQAQILPRLVLAGRDVLPKPSACGKWQSCDIARCGAREYVSLCSIKASGLCFHLPALHLQPRYVQPGLRLEATVNMSLAFQIWHKLSTVSEQNSQHLQTRWRDMLKTCAAQIVARMTSANFTLLDALVDVSATSPVPEKQSTSLLASYLLLKPITCAAEPWLLILTDMMNCIETDGKLVLRDLVDVTAAHSRQQTREHGVASTCHPYFAHLQQMVVLLKIADILASVKQEAAGVTIAKRAVWECIHQLDMAFHKELEQDRTHLVLPTTLDRELVSNCKALLKVIVPLMPQLLQSSQSFDHGCAARCLKLLNVGMLQADTSSHAAQAIAEHTVLQGLMCSTAVSNLLSLELPFILSSCSCTKSKHVTPPANMCGHIVALLPAFATL